MNPATAPHGPGPKSTPTFADNRLFTLGISGIVTAFDAASGKQIWQKTADPVEPLYHTAMSPLVDGNQVILHVGGHDNGALTAFDVATGERSMELEWRRAGVRLSAAVRSVGHAPGRDVHAEELRGRLARRREAALAPAVHDAVQDDQPDADPLQGHGDRDGTRQRRDRVPCRAA